MIRGIFKLLLFLVVAATLLAAGFCLYVENQTREFIFQDATAVPQTEVAVVLGASVTSRGDLSPVLKERADKAIELYNAKVVRKILVTGDNGTVAHNEVDPVGRYLVAAGVPKQDVFLDHAGFDTYSSMYRARDVFAIKNMIIVSQQFHLPRAVYIARSLGLGAYGVPADQNGLLLFNYAREIPATLKAGFDLVFERLPKYLGTQYPISGDGSETWGGYQTYASSTPIQIWK